jgi:hypothetical protein
MKYVYLIMSGEGYGRVLAVCEEKGTATLYVNMHAAVNLGMDINKADCPPLDFDGALMRYGWADKVWWQKEVVY